MHETHKQTEAFSVQERLRALKMSTKTGDYSGGKFKQMNFG